MGLVEALEKLQKNAIYDLNISLDDKYANEFAQAIACNTSLHMLYLSRSKLTKRGIKTIARAIFQHSSIKTLVFTDCTLDGEFFEEYSATSEITSLTLSRILLRSGIRRLIEISPVALQRLDLSENQIDIEGIKILVKFLESSHNLLSLSLSNNLINNKSAELLAGYLQKDLSLVSLDLAHNKIGNSGARALANALRENSTLNFLNLDANQLGNEGAIAFAETLKTNKSLRLLNLDAAKPLFRQTPKLIGKKGLVALVSALKVNEGLLALCLDHHKLSSAAIEALIELQKKQRFISIHIATFNTNPSETVVLKELIKRNLSSIDKFLQAASEHQEDNLIQWLESGIDPLITNSYNNKEGSHRYSNHRMNTALHYAAKIGWERGVKLILNVIKANNLDPLVKNIDGQTALDIAKEMVEREPEKNYQEIIELMQSYQNCDVLTPDLLEAQVPAFISYPTSVNSKKKKSKEEDESVSTSSKRSSSTFFSGKPLSSSEAIQLKSAHKKELGKESKRSSTMEERLIHLEEKVKKITIEKKQLKSQFVDMQGQLKQLQEEMLQLQAKQSSIEPRHKEESVLYYSP